MSKSLLTIARETRTSSTRQLIILRTRYLEELNRIPNDQLVQATYRSELADLIEVITKELETRKHKRQQR